MIGVIVLGKNEEKNISACLKSLAWADELIVIDDCSSDQTAALAKKTRAKVFQRCLGQDFAAQRNWALTKAQTDWVLFVDADERVTPQLAEEIKEVVRQTGFNGFYLKRKDWLWGQWLNHGETTRVRLLRLARLGSGSWQRQVHEVWQVKGKIGELKNPLLHYPHQNLTQFLTQINFYSSLHAQALKKEGKKAGWATIVFYPLFKFIQNYFVRWGVLDGMPGLIMALMMSLHSFLAQGKLYCLWKK